jgi:hypothetical protein
VGATTLRTGLLLAAAGLAAPALACFAAFGPARADRLAEEAGAADLAPRVAAAEALPAPGPVDRARLRALGLEVERLEGIVAGLGRAGDLAPRLRAAAAAAGLVLRAETPFEAAAGPGGPCAQGAPRERPGRFRKRLTLAGDFAAVGRFARAVEELPDLLRFTSLAVRRPAEPGPLAVEVALEVVKGGGAL